MPASPNEGVPVTTTNPICFSIQSRDRLHFGDYTERYEVTVFLMWDGESAWEEEQGDRPLPPITQLGYEDSLKYQTYQKAVAWVASEMYRVRPDVYFDKGDTVEVFKGRKVPKGTYTVVDEGKGDYGPYVNLRSPGGGGVYRFVTPGNCRRVIRSTPLDAHLKAIREAPGHDKLEKGTRLQILGDAMQDEGHEFADAVRAYGRRLVREDEILVASWAK